MTLTINDLQLDRPLTKAEELEVRNYVEMLVARAPRPSAGRPLPRENIDEICRIMEKLGGEKDGVALAHEANDIRAAADPD